MRDKPQVFTSEVASNSLFSSKKVRSKFAPSSLVIARYRSLSLKNMSSDAAQTQDITAQDPAPAPTQHVGGSSTEQVKDSGATSTQDSLIVPVPERAATKTKKPHVMTEARKAALARANAARLAKKQQRKEEEEKQLKQSMDKVKEKVADIASKGVSQKRKHKDESEQSSSQLESPKSSGHGSLYTSDEDSTPDTEARKAMRRYRADKKARHHKYMDFEAEETDASGSGSDYDSDVITPQPTQVSQRRLPHQRYQQQQRALPPAPIKNRMTGYRSALFNKVFPHLRWNFVNFVVSFVYLRLFPK